MLQLKTVICQNEEKKISEWAKQQWEDDEYKEKMKQKAKDMWENEEYRNKMILKSKQLVGEKNPFYGKQHTDETREIIRQKLTGRKSSNETRKKLSEARIRLWQNEEYRQHMTTVLQGEGNPHYGKRHTEDVKNRIGDLNGIPVVQLDLNDNYISEYRSAKMAESETGVNRVSIGRCCAGKQKTAGGFHWKIKKEWDLLQLTIPNELEATYEL
jgi:hypothetical protein